MDAITARGALRGRSEVHVAPGGYAENIILPLNTIAPHGKLIAINPMDGTLASGGAVYLTAAVDTDPVITVRARGWLIQGFEIDTPANDGGLTLDAVSANCNANYTTIRNCVFWGGDTGTHGIDFKGPAHYVKIYDCDFQGQGGKAIMCSETPSDLPGGIEIAHCRFQNNVNGIAMNPRGFWHSWIHDCMFAPGTTETDPDTLLDNRGGQYTIIGPNNFLSSTYDAAGGYYAGTNETWRGNRSEDSDNGTVGTGQVNPA